MDRFTSSGLVKKLIKNQTFNKRSRLDVFFFRGSKVNKVENLLIYISIKFLFRSSVKC